MLGVFMELLVFYLLDLNGKVELFDFSNLGG